MRLEPNIAPEGTICVCSACGKTSKDKTGIGKNGWDGSCFLRAILCKEGTLEYDKDGYVTKAGAAE